MELEDILELVGKLEDSTEEGSAADRFRSYLSKNAKSVGILKEYVDECLGKSGTQYNRALQDIVNHIGRLLGFEVEFGRYQGVSGKIGFDGFWISPIGKSIVVETKTTDTYSIDTNTLLDYRNRLSSEGKIKDKEDSIGLYVFGETDYDQVKNDILANKREKDLRVITVDALLNLLEVKQDYGIEHETILNLLQPSPPEINPTINLIFELISQEKRESIEKETEEIEVEDEERSYYLLPVKNEEEKTAEQILENLLGQEIWGLGKGTPYRKEFEPGDKLCFYAVRTGIMATATVKSKAREETHPAITKDEYPFVIDVGDVEWLDKPIELTEEIRGQLSAFEDKDPSGSWGWFVQGTSKLTKKDFRILAGEN